MLDRSFHVLTGAGDLDVDRAEAPLSRRPSLSPCSSTIEYVRGSGRVSMPESGSSGTPKGVWALSPLEALPLTCSSSDIGDTSSIAIHRNAHCECRRDGGSEEGESMRILRHPSQRKNDSYLLADFPMSSIRQLGSPGRLKTSLDKLPRQASLSLTAWWAVATPLAPGHRASLCQFILNVFSVFDQPCGLCSVCRR